MEMTWDDIDAHTTNGSAEEVALRLNEGWTPRLCAKLFCLELRQIHRIMVDPSYGVLSEEARAFERLRQGAHLEKIWEAKRLIRSIQKGAKNVASV